MGWRRALAGVGALMLFGACLVTVDLDDLQTGAATGAFTSTGGTGGSGTGGGGTGGETPLDCPPGRKVCEDECVSILDPATGCNAESCDVCALPNAVSACLGGCVPLSCVLGFQDCDIQVEGCETPLSDLQNCNECGTICQPFHATGDCGPSGCDIGACDADFDDCDVDPATGCEENIVSDPHNCLGCGNDCYVSPGEWTCEGGCQLSPCATGIGDCITTGVCNVVLATDEAHCGFCNNACDFANAVEICNAGECEIDSCVAPYDDCDSVLQTGCETNLGTSPSHCGSCGHSCLGGTCSGGKCQPMVLAAGQNRPFGLAVDASFVYWTTLGQDTGMGMGALMRTAITGGPVTVLAPGLTDARAVAVDAMHAYFTEFGGRVARVPLNGGSTTNVAGDAGSWDIFVRTTYVYWAATGSGSIMRRLTSLMTPAQPIVPNQGFVWDMDFEGSYVYYTLPTANRIQRSLLAGGTTEVLLDKAAEYLSAYNGYIYYAVVGADTSVERLSTALDAVEEVLVTGPWMVGAIDVDASGVYLADYGGNAIVVIPIAGGSATALASGQPYPSSIVVTNNSIYWTNLDGGTVMRLAK